MTELQQRKRQRDIKRKHDVYRQWELFCKNMDTPEAVAWLRSKCKVGRTRAYQLVREFVEKGEPR